MKVNAVSNIGASSIYGGESKRKTFKGYVNGNYYSDEIIKKAKKALFDSNWKEKILAKKRTLKDSFSSWHNRSGQNDIAGRVLMGVFTLGLTEVTWGLTQAAMDAMDNDNIDKEIEEIERCIEDLRKGG